MNKTKKTLIGYGASLVIIIALFATGVPAKVLGSFQKDTKETGTAIQPREKEKAPLAIHDAEDKANFEMTLINSEGETVQMEEFKGKVIFMNFWATWCPPCIAEMPGINNLYNDIQGKEVVFLMISFDQNFQKAIDFRKEKGYDFEIYKLAGPMPQMYATTGIPATYVIGADEKLALSHLGMGDYDTEEFKTFLQNLRD